MEAIANTSPLSLVAVLTIVVVAGFIPLGPAMPVADAQLPEDPTDCWNAARPCTLVEGTSEGTLVQGANDVDHYELAPPPEGSILTIEVEPLDGIGAGFGMFVDVEDPGHVLRDRAEGTGALEVSTVGAPQGTWHVEVGFHDPTVLKLPPWNTGQDVIYPNPKLQQDYAITLSYQPVDNVAPLSGPGSPAPTVTAAFEEQDARIDLYYDSTVTLPANNSWGTVTGILIDGVTVEGEEEGGGGLSTQMWSRYPFSETKVWTKGTIAPVLGEEVSLDGPTVFDDDLQYARLTVNMDSDTYRILNVSVGLAYSEGIDGVNGWLAWNGSEEQRPDVDFPSQGTSVFAGTEDMRGDGTGARAGGVSYGEHLSKHFAVGADQFGQLTVRSDNIASHPPDPRFTVDLPNGTSESLEGEVHTWALDDLIPGRWTITMDERAGAEYGQLWIAGASFPFLPG